MKKVLLLLFDGFEEVEALTPVDILRRAGAEVLTLTVGKKDKEVVGRSGIAVKADGVINFSADFSHFDMLVIPGGGGVLKIADMPELLNLVRSFAKRDAFLAAICAAPVVLFNAGTLDGKRRTAYPSMCDEIGDCENSPVVRDGKIITSRGAGTAMTFALELVSALFDEAKTKEIAKSVCFDK